MRIRIQARPDQTRQIGEVLAPVDRGGAQWEAGGAQCHPTSCQLVRARKLGGGPYKDPQYYRGESTHENSENSENSEGRRLLYACA